MNGTTWIPPALARERAKRIRDLRYALDLVLEARARVLSGRQTITLAFDRRG